MKQRHRKNASDSTLEAADAAGYLDWNIPVLFHYRGPPGFDGQQKQSKTSKNLLDAEDEATPNTALVVFLQCVTGLVTGVPLE
jgi:hypothetical protein